MWALGLDWLIQILSLYGRNVERLSVQLPAIWKVRVERLACTKSLGATLPIRIKIVQWPLPAPYEMDCPCSWFPALRILPYYRSLALLPRNSSPVGGVSQIEGLLRFGNFKITCCQTQLGVETWKVCLAPATTDQGLAASMYVYVRPLSHLSVLIG